MKGENFFKYVDSLKNVLRLEVEINKIINRYHYTGKPTTISN